MRQRRKRLALNLLKIAPHSGGRVPAEIIVAFEVGGRRNKQRNRVRAFHRHTIRRGRIHEFLVIEGKLTV